MAGLESALKPLEEFRRLPRNPKTHDLGELSLSADRFGFLERVIVNRTTGHLVAGHGRVDLLRSSKERGENPPQNVEVGELGGDWLVPTDYVDLAEEEEEAAAVALNRLTELGGWDSSALADVLKDLAEADALEGIGYDADDVSAMIEAADVSGIEFPEYDESAADDVKTVECPECGHEFPA